MSLQPQAIQPISLAAHCLEVAAQTAVDVQAYSQHQAWLNLSKVRQLGEAFRAGWLHNLMARITPMTARDTGDYVLMADLFILNARDAKNLLQKMSADLTQFATQAGINPANPDAAAYQYLNAHLSLYSRIGSLLASKYEISVPRAFSSCTIQSSKSDNTIFLRDFLRTRAA